MYEDEQSKTDISAIWPIGELMGYCCFVAVAEELHFTRASQRLRMDQSVVSRHIQKLESNLGLKLFVRGERRAELTEAGRAFLSFARKALLAAKAGVRVTQAIAKGEPQEFEVAYSPLVDVHLIAQIRDLIEKSRSAIPVRFRSVPPDKLVERLLASTSHIAIGVLPIEGDLTSECILREELFTVLPASHRLASKACIALSEIGADPVIWASGVIQSVLTNHLFGLFRRAGYIPNVAHETQTIAEVLGLAREGLGVTFVKTSDRHLVGDGLVIRPLAKPLFIETGLLCVPELGWDALTRLVSLVRTHFRCQKQHPAD